LEGFFFSVEYGQGIGNITKYFSEKNEMMRSKLSFLDLNLTTPPAQEDHGYTVTDLAIKYCPPDSKWLLVTNADTEYSPKIFSFLFQATDAISFNFFAKAASSRRYDRFPLPTKGDVFPHKSDNCSTRPDVICYWNKNELYAMDVGSVIWNLDKWKKDKISFSKYTPTCCHDGLLMDEVRDNKGWIVTRVPFCYLSKADSKWVQCRHDLVL
jgi:hypothetical protein